MANTLSPALRIQRLCLAFLVIATPLSTWHIVEKPFAISYLNVIAALFILVSAYCLATRQLAIRPFTDKQTAWVIGFLFLVMAYALLFTHPLRNGAGLWFSRLLEPAAAGWLVYQMLAASVVKIEEIVRWLLLSIIPLVIWILLQEVHLFPVYEAHRLTASYQFPNTFARYVEIVLLVTAPWILQRLSINQVKSEGWNIALWTIGLFLLLGSISYNGVSTFVIGSITILLFLPSAYKKLKQWSFTGLVVLAAIIAPNLSRLPKWQTSITISRMTRLEFWEVAKGMLHGHIWTGIGLKGWETQYSRVVAMYSSYHPPLSLTSLQPQDIFLDSLLKAGIPGLLAVTLLLLWPIWRSRLLSRRPFADYGWFGVSLLGYGVAMLLFGVIDDPIWSDDTMLLLFTFLAMLGFLAAVRTETQNKKAATRR